MSNYKDEYQIAIGLQVSFEDEAYVLSDEHCELVETADLNHKGDQLHFNAAAQRRLGKRYAEKMVELYIN